MAAPGHRRDERLHFLEPADLAGEPRQLLVEAFDLAGALQLDQLPLVVGVLTHRVPQLGLGADFELLDRGAGRIPGTVP